MDRGTPSWLVAGGPVSWADVRALNARRCDVASRAVLADPPPDSEIPPEMRLAATAPTTRRVAVVALIVVMALLEVVLLAGPAFAVSARRQARTLALMAATGGTPRQARRVVLAAGVVLGGAAAVLGVRARHRRRLGAAAARSSASGTLVRAVRRAVAAPGRDRGFGLVSALLAAVVPALDRLAAGRRRGARRSPWRPRAVAALAGARPGAARRRHRRVGVRRGPSPAASSSSRSRAIVAVLGMILLVPVVVARWSPGCRGRLPLVLRYAVRDAARHRTRTVPAVAAVAATVAGVVALGIGVTSDEAQNEASYTPSIAAGVGVVTGYEPDGAVAGIADSSPRAAGRPVTALRGPADDGR